jgi:hypothetical protein
MMDVRKCSLWGYGLEGDSAPRLVTMNDVPRYSRPRNSAAMPPASRVGAAGTGRAHAGAKGGRVSGKAALAYPMIRRVPG